MMGETVTEAQPAIVTPREPDVANISGTVADEVGVREVSDKKKEEE